MLMIHDHKAGYFLVFSVALGVWGGGVVYPRFVPKRRRHFACHFRPSDRNSELDTLKSLHINPGRRRNPFGDVGNWLVVGCHGVSKPPVLRPQGVSLGGSGVSIGGVRSLRVGSFCFWGFGKNVDLMVRFFEVLDALDENQYKQSGNLTTRKKVTEKSTVQ